ncbi:MAG: hypothetical protein M3Q81_00095 [bacterium]|nr:hypothetical protein [bacterium]
MKQRNLKSNIQSGFALAAVTAVSFTLIGGTSATAMHSSGDSGNMPAHEAFEHDMRVRESKAASDLRKGLDSLLQDHVTTNLTVNRAIVSGASEEKIDAAEQAQLANTAGLAAAIESIYGPAAAMEFSTMFNEHIEESNNFARAVANGDESAKALAIEELEEYLVDLTNFLVTAIPVLPYDTVYGLFLEHEALINQSTEAEEMSNFGESKNFEHQAIRQVSVIADALASGIIATQPALFDTMDASHMFESRFDSHSSMFVEQVNVLATKARADLGNDGSQEVDAFMMKFDTATAKLDTAVANSASKAESKNQFIDSYSNARAEYFNELEHAKNDFAAVVSNLGNDANQAKDAFIGGYNSAKGVYGDNLEGLRNDHAAHMD